MSSKLVVPKCLKSFKIRAESPCFLALQPLVLPQSMQR